MDYIGFEVLLERILVGFRNCLAKILLEKSKKKSDDIRYSLKYATGSIPLRHRFRTYYPAA